MLQEFFVDNFKSLINIVFRPHEQNLLVGLNNSGKTNLCHAMTFLRTTAGLPLDKCADYVAGGRLGLRNHFLRKPTIDFRITVRLPYEGETLTFQYELSIVESRSASFVPALEVEHEQLTATGGGFEDTVLIENTRNGVKLLHEADFLKGQLRYAETSAPRDLTMVNRLYDLKTNPRSNHFKRYLSSWTYYSLSPAAMRGSDHSPNQTVLSWNGDNLASVLYQLKTSNERKYRKLLEYLRRFDRRIELINFQVPSEANIFMFLEDAGGNTTPAWTTSDGTLRWLALTYVMLIQPAPAERAVVMIEEPENGIYVGFLKELLAMVAESDARPLLIFTSHSPYFIDLFDEHVDEIFVLKRGDQHSTLSQPDPDIVRVRLETFPLGEQHFREMLG